MIQFMEQQVAINANVIRLLRESIAYSVAVQQFLEELSPGAISRIEELATMNQFEMEMYE